MRKFVYSFVVIALLLCLTSCSSKQDFSANSFIDEFQLDLADENLLIEKMFDSYEGMPSSGVALYRIGFGGAECKEIEQWDDIPLSEDAEYLIGVVSVLVDFPEVEEGKYVFVNRSGDKNNITKATLCVYDEQNNVAYYLKFDTIETKSIF